MTPRVAIVARYSQPGPRRLAQFCILLLALAVVASCATGRAVRRADSAATRGDWDSAVTSYREALSNAPGRADLKIKLDRATRLAAAEHMRRARDLEADDQLPGALAEYRRAAELEPSSTIATSKAIELERTLRQQSEAARPRPRVETLREQNAQSGTIPRLDPRTVVPQMRFTNAAVRDLLRTISELTNINITYDQGLDAALTRPHTIDIQQTPLEDVLNQVLQAQQLTFKVVNTRTIFVYQDSAQNRQRYEDQYIQTFFLSSADPTALMGSLNQLIAGLQIPVAPRITANPATSTMTVRASAPVLQVIESFIKSNDRPVPEVLIEAEILEVDRAFVRQLGLDLNQWAVGFTFSPELAPTGAAGSIPQGTPPPFSINTLSQGVSPADFYATSPTALVRLLESNSNTKILARPSSRGAAGKPVTLTLGSNVPIPTTQFFSQTGGGVANTPTTSVTYQAVGVNLSFTPKVTYQDDIILESLSLEKSGLGANIDVGGQSFPTIISRRSQSNIRLRDGESTLISGLLLDDDRQTNRTFPGLSGIPILRSIFGSGEHQVEQTDIIMVLTAKIVRGYDLQPSDLRPQYIGTGQNIGASPAPALLSPEALNANPASTQTALSVTGGPTVQTAAGVGPGGVTTNVAARGVEIAPIQAPGAPRPAAPQTPARLVVTPPAAGPDGGLAAGSGPHSVPIQISGATGVASVTLTITFDPAVVRMATMTQGSFLMQGGVQPTVTAGPTAAGRLEVTITRPPYQSGANGSGVLAALTFLAGTAGQAEVNVTGVATMTTGQTAPLQATPTRVVVR